MKQVFKYCVHYWDPSNVRRILKNCFK